MKKKNTKNNKKKPKHNWVTKYKKPSKRPLSPFVVIKAHSQKSKT